MKLQPKREIDSLKQKERKIEIDEGLKLVTQVEELRRLRLDEEKNLTEYREKTTALIKVEIDSLIEDRDNLFKWNTQAREEREKLLEPLDREWKELDKAKEQLIADKQELYLRGEQLKIEQQKDREVKKSILHSIDKARKIESEANRLFDEAILFKENAENEYLLAKSEHDIQSEEYGRRLADVNLLRATYQNGVNVNALDEKKLKEREEELIIREKDLDRRTKVLQAIEGVQNGKRKPANN